MCSCGSQLGRASYQQEAAQLGNSPFWSTLLGSLGAGLGYPTIPDSEGWYDYCEYPAPPNALCQFEQWRGGYRNNWTGYSRDFSPYFNITNLKWRYTGIAKEERGL